MKSRQAAYIDLWSIPSRNQYLAPMMQKQTIIGDGPLKKCQSAKICNALLTLLVTFKSN